MNSFERRMIQAIDKSAKIGKDKALESIKDLPWQYRKSAEIFLIPSKLRIALILRANPQIAKLLYEHL